MRIRRAGSSAPQPLEGQSKEPLVFIKRYEWCRFLLGLGQNKPEIQQKLVSGTAKRF